MRRVGFIAAVMVIVSAVVLVRPTGAQAPATPGTAESCRVAVDGGTVYSGSGHQVLDIGRLDVGVYLIHGLYNGTGDAYDFFGVELTGRATGNLELTFLLEVSPFDEETVLRIREDDADDYLMEVDAAGDWEITIAPA